MSVTNQRSMLEILPGDLLIQIAEYMDVKTILSFMRTNKSIRNWIKEYEHSICKARAALYPVRPSGNILLSQWLDRSIVPHNSIKQTAELERRASRIDQLCSDCTSLTFMQAWSPPWFPRELPAAPKSRLATLMRRALWQCDAISDGAANSSRPIPGEVWDLLEHGVFENRPLDPELRDVDPSTNPLARPIQIAYINSLSMEDCLVLFYLVGSLAAEFCDRQHLWSDRFMSHSRKECVCVFEECMLRHGSWFLWGQTMPRSHQRVSSVFLKRAGMSELIAYECGDETIPEPLKMQLTKRLRGAFPTNDKLRGAYENLLGVEPKPDENSEEDED